LGRRLARFPDVTASRDIVVRCAGEEACAFERAEVVFGSATDMPLQGVGVVSAGPMPPRDSLTVTPSSETRVRRPRLARRRAQSRRYRIAAGWVRLRRPVGTGVGRAAWRARSCSAGHGSGALEISGAAHPSISSLSCAPRSHGSARCSRIVPGRSPSRRGSRSSGAEAFATCWLDSVAGATGRSSRLQLVCPTLVRARLIST